MIHVSATCPSVWDIVQRFPILWKIFFFTVLDHRCTRWWRWWRMCLISRAGMLTSQWFSKSCMFESSKDIYQLHGLCLLSHVGKVLFCSWSSIPSFYCDLCNYLFYPLLASSFIWIFIEALGLTWFQCSRGGCFKCTSKLLGMRVLKVFFSIYVAFFFLTAFQLTTVYNQWDIGGFNPSIPYILLLSYREFLVMSIVLFQISFLSGIIPDI